MSHTELQRRIIASKNEEIAKLRELLEEWMNPDNANYVRFEKLLERTREVLGK